MREPLTAERLHLFMKALAAEARSVSSVYFVGGASSVLLGWRTSTIDVDLKIIPESDEILRSLPQIKERLHVNIELASPADFIPELPGWQERSPSIHKQGKLAFFHYDFYAQALAKIERGFSTDLEDVAHMIGSGLVKPERLQELFSAIEDQIYLYPELDREKFRHAVDRVVQEAKTKEASD